MNQQKYFLFLLLFFAVPVYAMEMIKHIISPRSEWFQSEDNFEFNYWAASYSYGHISSQGIKSALMWAVEKNSIKVVATLNKCSFDVNVKDNGTAALITAAGKGSHDMVLQLLQNPKIDVNAKDNYGKTALESAAIEGYANIVSCLCDHPKINLTAVNNRGFTAFMEAVRKGQAAVVKEFLKNEAVTESVLNDRDSDGKTALMWACMNGHETIMMDLCGDSKVKLDAVDHAEKTALMYAAENGFCARLLVSSFNLACRDKDGKTALMWATKAQNPRSVDALINGAIDQINILDNEGKTALIWAAIEGNIPVVRALLSRRNINVEMQDTIGMTALMWAAKKGHMQVVQELLAKEVDRTKIDHNGKTALRHAEDNGFEDIVGELRIADII